jgi:hypothetical protein
MYIATATTNKIIVVIFTFRFISKKTPVYVNYFITGGVLKE